MKNLEKNRGPREGRPSAPMGRPHEGTKARLCRKVVQRQVRNRQCKKGVDSLQAGLLLSPLPLLRDVPAPGQVTSLCLR